MSQYRFSLRFVLLCNTSSCCTFFVSFCLAWAAAARQKDVYVLYHCTLLIWSFFFWLDVWLHSLLVLTIVLSLSTLQVLWYSWSLLHFCSFCFVVTPYCIYRCVSGIAGPTVAGQEERSGYFVACRPRWLLVYFIVSLSYFGCA